MNVSNNINSAIISGTLGIQRASEGITQHSANLASFAASKPVSDNPQEFLANAVLSQLGAIKQSLPTPTPGITNDLVGLSINSINAQASAKVAGTANETVGTLLNILA
jgi:hypothetical protein